MERSQAWYIHERAEQMAMMVFTRAPGIVVRPAPVQLGIDLIVMSAKIPGRMFGVELKASTSISTIVAKTNLVRQSVAAPLQKRLSTFPFPVGLMACGMQDDSAYFGWILAPELRDGASSRALSTPSPIIVEPATREVIERAVEQVLNWYNILGTQQVVSPSLQHPSAIR
ncbi:MAG: DUF4365 domain-containing protein [Armatimonadota bacterium]|nr:DUF4365 domain-containing protein [Armatimonadota bacterium]